MQQKVQVVSSRSRQMNSQLQQQFGSQTRSAPMMTFNSLSKTSLPASNSKSNDIVDPFRERQQDYSSDGQQEQGKESQESSTNDTDVVAAMPV